MRTDAVPILPIALHFSIPSSANRWPKQVARLLLPLLHAFITAAATPAPLGQQKGACNACATCTIVSTAHPVQILCMSLCMHACGELRKVSIDRCVKLSVIFQ
ncbi:unnamed protein product [Brugia pahangi]|uniref:Secreted protein n=1 Tax=Brugia pahangi TaxID=6280 RepID=A0A0N4TKK7_BRUPA|nr:unnamed protein product [Brugia pahangi]